MRILAWNGVLEFVACQATVARLDRQNCLAFIDNANSCRSLIGARQIGLAYLMPPTHLSAPSIVRHEELALDLNCHALYPAKHAHRQSSFGCADHALHRIVTGAAIQSGRVESNLPKYYSRNPVEKPRRSTSTCHSSNELYDPSRRRIPSWLQTGAPKPVQCNSPVTIRKSGCHIRVLAHPASTQECARESKRH